MNFIPQVVVRVYVPHMDRTPVSAPFGESVGQEPAVMRGLPLRKRDGTVGRQCVWVQNESSGRGQAGAHIERGLTLQTGVLRIKKTPAFVDRNGNLGVVP